jgi:hypothetical protein
MALDMYSRLVRTTDKAVSSEEAVSFNETANASDTVPYLHVVCCTAQLSVKLVAYGICMVHWYLLGAANAICKEQDG